MKWKLLFNQLNLRQARRIRDKTQDEMAELLNVHVQTYRKIEENPDLATVEQAKKIAQYLNLPYNENFFDS